MENIEAYASTVRAAMAALYVLTRHYPRSYGLGSAIEPWFYHAISDVLENVVLMRLEDPVFDCLARAINLQTR